MMKKLSIIFLIAIFLSGCSLGFEEAYITNTYDNSKVIKELKINKDLNSDNCYIEKAITIKNNEKELLCQFVKVKAFHDGMYLMVSIDTTKDLIYDISIIEHYETEDYGGYVSDKWFLDRFRDKDVNIPLESVVMINKKDNQIVAITGATITSKAVVNSVNLCMKNYNSYKRK